MRPATAEIAESAQQGSGNQEDTGTVLPGRASCRGAHTAAGHSELGESTDKPGSVEDNHSSGMCVTTHLKRPTRPQCGSHLLAISYRGPIWSCSERGLPCHELLPVARCALTAPFHPYLCLPGRNPNGHRRSALCCTFRRLAPPRRYLAPHPMEPGLSSTTPPESGATAIVWLTRREG